MNNLLFPTTTVGSMPRPKYIKDLIEHEEECKQGRTFQKLMDKAVPHIIQMQDYAGIDIISDGEWRRKSYIGIIADICSGFEMNIKKVNGERQTWHTKRLYTYHRIQGEFGIHGEFIGPMLMN